MGKCRIPNEAGEPEEAFVPRESPARDGFYAPEESRCFGLLLLGGLFACLGIAVASLCLGSIRFSPLALIRMLALFLYQSLQS